MSQYQDLKIFFIKRKKENENVWLITLYTLFMIFSQTFASDINKKMISF